MLDGAAFFSNERSGSIAFGFARDGEEALARPRARATKEAEGLPYSEQFKIARGGRRRTNRRLNLRSAGSRNAALDRV